MSHAKTKPPFAKTVPPFSKTTPPMEAAPPAPQEIQIVRYSLPALLAEIAHERSAGSYAMEKMHQAEINKMYTNNPRSRRGKAKR